MRMLTFVILTVILFLGTYAEVQAQNWPGLKEAGFDKDIDAAVNWSDGKVHFFRGSRYVRFDIKADKVDDGYPKNIADGWPGLKEAGFDEGIDAAVNWSDGKVYFFLGSRYARRDIKADKVDDGYPKNIADGWPGLKEAGFDNGIDAAVNWGNGKVYFFHGHQYMRYDVSADKTDDGYPKDIADGWSGLKEAGFDKGVRAVVNWGDGKAYFFRGFRYVRFDIKADKVDDGYPKNIADQGTVALTRVREVAGVWNSDWGPVTLQTTPSKDGKSFTVRGSYDSNTGANRKGLIKSGTFDPATGILAFALEEPWWGNDTKGTAKLTLAANGRKLEGPYLKTNKDGGRDEGTVTLTHVSDTEWKADVAGIWESPWGIVTLRTAHAGDQKLSVTGSYNSITGKNRTGLIESGVYDPATGILEFALEEPWWGNQTKGSARLTLDAAGNRFKGSYAKTNQDGGKDKGEVSLLRLGGSNFAAALDSIFADAGIKADTPGAAVMVIDHGKVVFSRCAGLARLTDKKPITPQTTFELCSVSKSFTGAAILRLYDQGKLELEDDIRKFIPEMPVYDAKNSITILHVARMTSGMPDAMYAENVKSKNPDYLTNEDFAGEFARQRKKFPLKYPTGQGWEYSNTGYMVLGLLVERASKQSYSAFMKKEFFNPLGMKTAGVSATASIAPPNPAYSYMREKDVFRFGCGPPSIMPRPLLLPVGHSCVYASLDDMERWDAGWRQGKIIKPATQKLALVPSTYGDNIPNVYAFGWGLTVAKGEGLRRMEHNGSYAGFETFIDRDVAEQRTLVVLCNVDSVDVVAIARIFKAMPPKRQQK